ncbi:CubicO group peptidase (beta-lactamase class C family) [Homoserinimonas aerilata]|uniref:CubicO group peptidase (Beta-lactamase class C family) n=1 Tax=Homoserinimonas aerilata TaxID=1162970 RepID=A0A542YA42_9MICO|nr:serine hydrolase domain-containing protein [Homoserinimonas aerilata]TQL44922.1 CubicO group peptidase (beta-lactamase class C family) [Homoserinimonas aerilata]
MIHEVHGHVVAGFEPVRDAFAAAFDEQPTMGAALAIRHNGVVVVDLWGGVADERTGSPWEEDTLSVIFSCTKGLVSVLAARLVQEGLIDYWAPVSRYWPEFAAAGKSSVRVKDVLAHRSGVSAPRHPMTVDDITDWDTVVTHLAAQEPLWEPDTGYAYHALTHGWLMGEIIRRVTGKTVGEYFSEVVAIPLGADAWIGLPEKQQSRVAHLQVGSTLAELVAQQEAARPSGVTDWSERAMTLGGALPPELVGTDSGFNNPVVRAAEIPGAGGIATARALASIWSATIGETDGVRLLEDSAIEAATELQSEGPPVWDVPGPWPRWGMGLQLDSEPRRFVTERGFGHDGAGGQAAFADPGAGIGFAFLTNRMEAIADVRATRIVDSLRTVLGITR